MRIRKAFPSLAARLSSVASTRDVATQQEETEVSSFAALAETTAKEAPEEVDTDWESIKARAHKLLGCSFKTSNFTIRPYVLEEHSSTNTVSIGETDIVIPSTNVRNKKSLLELENPSQTMVVEQGGGNARNQISGLFLNSQMKGNCSDRVNTKRITVSSPSHQGYSKGIFLGNWEGEKAETNMKTGGDSSQKKRTDPLKIGSSQCAFATSRGGLNYKDEDEDDEEDEEHSSGGSIKKKVKTRSLTSIYADSRSRMPTSPEFKGE